MFLRFFLEEVGTFCESVRADVLQSEDSTYMIGGCKSAVWSSDLAACGLQSLKSLLDAPISARLARRKQKLLTGEVTS